MRSLILLFSVLVIALSSSCNALEKTPLTEEQQVFAGRWVSNDGTWLHIYNNGGGDLKTSNKSVEGGKTMFTAEDEFEIGLFGLKKTYKVDKAPYEEDGAMKMVLNGIVYTKSNF
ncbi:MAG: hypothetical protein KTR13_10250 [Saprospiraceae bacterium]|nr:hypothetical protein [Saprospiraceae bacterium]